MSSSLGLQACLGTKETCVAPCKWHHQGVVFASWQHVWFSGNNPQTWVNLVTPFGKESTFLQSRGDPEQGLGTRRAVVSGSTWGPEPPSQPAAFGRRDLEQMALSLYLCPSILGRGENNVPSASALSFPRSEDECHPHCSLEPGPHLSLEAFSRIICCKETETAPPPPPPPPAARSPGWALTGSCLTQLWYYPTPPLGSC